ncbi:uncharacterized protein Z519_11194 [Cladophialophora bantiana CBS 173.52]|uniref:Uncharacterized protein n=1 Tax=Cladophialophora bantiana (strain ATCC 10958 / CBS 173.52 / CDC B-1940 / NIH 8579) TaxID=1442370 RepID=A0A0D2HU92_CLAB1|nr:uncharacterized protein Z519_11194 [Cladophialophora bantiana CBS 173.52]KIW88084.1 hypothetical protein Z519_11194 [Cladophialophora bantiana CBS 173.52]
MGKSYNDPGSSKNGGLASVSMEMGILHETMQSIAPDMKTFAKLNLFGQIMKVGSLITSGAAVEYIKKLEDQAGRMRNSLDQMADNHDPETLVAYIVEHGRPCLGPESIVHILIPAISQLAISESLTFPEEVGPFRISGQLVKSSLPLVRLCAPLDRERQNLNEIGSLLPDRTGLGFKQLGVAYPL